MRIGKNEHNKNANSQTTTTLTNVFKDARKKAHYKHTANAERENGAGDTP